jgi:hypothetical protein
MPQTETARGLNMTKPTVNAIIQPARTRSPTSNLVALHALVIVQPRDGRSKKGAPGDELFLTVRKGVRKHPYHVMYDAPNRYLRERQVLDEIDRNIQPLGSLHLYNVLQFRAVRC